jgi:thiol:disulfide interchange protein
MNRSLTVISFLLIFTFGLNAQILEPVSWTFSSNKTGDKEFELIFKAEIDLHWHLYSQDIPMSPPATKFNFVDNADYSIIDGVTEESSVIEEYDPNFEMELKYFANEAIFKQKIKLNGDGAKIEGFVEFMSCDDTKCLPPTEVDFNFTLGTPSQSGTPVSQILEPVSWDIEVKKLDPKTLELVFNANIDKGYHLYSLSIPDDGPLPTVFTFENSELFNLSGDVTEAIIPIEEYDDVFEMDIKFFEENASFKQVIKLNKNEEQVPVVGEIAYMVCNEVGCVALYEDFEINIDAETGTIIKETEIVEEESSFDKDDITGKKASLLGFFILSFLGGLAAILTPCVFPMIPMTVSFFMKEGEDKAKGKMQAIIYGLSIIAIYVFIGSVLAVIAGPDIANWLSTHWLPNILFFVIFVVFAASFFGMFEITLPSWMINKSDQSADKGGFLGPVFMALTLVLVSFSCTGPIVGTILVESAGGQILKPIIGMLGFSLAFALPFTLFAFFPTLLQGLPKSGGWLNSVKVVLGFLELALGLKFLSIADQTYHWGILDREVYLASWIVIFFLLGMYLLGKIKFAHDSDIPFVSVPRLMLAIIVFTFVAYLVPGMVGAPLKALSGYLPPQTTHDFDLNAVIRENVKAHAISARPSKKKELCETPKYSEFLHLPHGLEGYFDYDQALACAKAQNKPLFIDFTGHGCVNCREMESNVWSNPKVLSLLSNDYIVTALYVDDKTTMPEEDWYISDFDGKKKKTIGKKYSDRQKAMFGVNAQPFYVLLDPNGELLTQPRAYDLDINEFVKFLKAGLKNFEKRK